MIGRRGFVGALLASVGATTVLWKPKRTFRVEIRHLDVNRICPRNTQVWDLDSGENIADRIPISFTELLWARKGDRFDVQLFSRPLRVERGEIAYEPAVLEVRGSYVLERLHRIGDRWETWRWEPFTVLRGDSVLGIYKIEV